MWTKCMSTLSVTICECQRTVKPIILGFDVLRFCVLGLDLTKPMKCYHWNMQCKVGHSGDTVFWVSSSSFISVLRLWGKFRGPIKGHCGRSNRASRGCCRGRTNLLALHEEFKVKTLFESCHVDLTAGGPNTSQALSCALRMCQFK